MGRSILGKTDTIKQRSIYVYLPSVEQKRRWDEQAQKQGVSISKFVAEHVENSLRQVEEQDYKSIGDLCKEVKQLKEQISKETREKRVLEIAVEKLEEELRRYRAQPFLEEGFAGVRRYQKELVEILRQGHLVSSGEILSRLGIKPSEGEAVKAVSAQLENLEKYGVVKVFPKGWKWIEK
jgi:predicted DNA-binding protein